MSDIEEPEIREGQRIAKVMARAGLCSRRDAEAWIAEGRVKVNGKVLDSPAYNVSESDDVRVDNEPLKSAERTRLFLFHKPRGLVTTARDPEGRSTIFDALPEDLPRVVAIGRLDINTEGLLLLTNDGGLSRVLELPATGWLRRYRVRAHGEVTQEQLDSLREGVTLDGMNYAGIDARFERQQGANVWIMMGLREGKNREIKRVLEHLGLEVNRLIRVSFGPFELGDLGEGEVVEVRTRVLRDQLGAKLAKQAGVDLETPIEELRMQDLPASTLVKAERVERPRSSAGPARPSRAASSLSRSERPSGRASFSDRAAPASGRPREGGERPRSGPKVFAGKEDRAVIAAEMAARGQRRETVAPPKRKHVLALRADAQSEVSGPRKRIERSATADRKGREIKVERVMRATPEPEAAAPEERRPVRARPSSDGPRTGRSFSPRSGGSAGEERRPMRSRPPSDGPREARSFSPRGERSGGSSGDDRRPSRSRPPSDGPREARSFSPRGERSGGSSGEDRRPSRPRPPSDGPREARSFSPRGERSGGSSGEDRRPSRPRPASDGPREARSFSPRGERSSKPEGSAGEGRRFSRPKPSSDGPREGRSARPEGQGRRPEFSGKTGERPKRSFSGGPAREGRPQRPGGDKPRGGSGGKRPPRKS